MARTNTTIIDFFGTTRCEDDDANGVDIHGDKYVFHLCLLYPMSKGSCWGALPTSMFLTYSSLSIQGKVPVDFNILLLLCLPILKVIFIHHVPSFHLLCSVEPVFLNLRRNPHVPPLQPRGKVRPDRASTRAHQNGVNLRRSLGHGRGEGAATGTTARS